MRIGQGFDVHAFQPGDHLVLGGVHIPFEQSFLAHSDGDVLLHAVSDALLGAAGLGDIGRHFPDTDANYAGIDSRLLLRNVVSQLETRGLRCTNVDATIIAQAPKMSPYIDAMVKNVAADLSLNIERVNVKATTTERLGFCGRGEGIAAMASVLLDESP
jgi:2-C-methyl-D-erythritol 2,4-cyclodiphosphate synthase